jgi:hypothetical protein
MPTVFVVRRRIDAEYREYHEVPEAGEQYAATCTTREAADEYARRLHREAAAELPFAEVNPFRGAKYQDLTSFPPHVFRDWLRDADVEPPPEVAAKRSRSGDPETTAWETWWDAVADSLTGSQRMRVWEGLNLFCLFEVVEVEAGEPVNTAGRVVYAVVCRNWQYDDSNYFGGNEPMAVYNTRGRAEEEARKLTEAGRVEVPAGEEFDEDGFDFDAAVGEYVVVELTIPTED